MCWRTATTDVTYAVIDEMEATFDRVARRARAELGGTAWRMPVMTLPPAWDGSPNHSHDATTEEAGREEVCIPLSGSAKLHTDEAIYDLQPGVMLRVGPDRRRRIVPHENGIRFIALDGVVGAHRPSPSTELGGPWPVPQDA